MKKHEPFAGLQPVKNASGIVALITFFYVMLVGVFTYNFHLPRTALYFSDILNVVLLVLCAREVPKALSFKRTRVFYIVLGLLLLEGTLSAAFQGFHVLWWVWSLRNWGRFFLYFLLCTIALDRNAIELTVRLVKYIFHLNFVVILGQFFIGRGYYGQDQLNGLYGREVNGVTITMILIMLCITYSEYFSGRCTWKSLIAVSFEVNLLSCISELRGVFFIQIALLIFYPLINVREKEFYKKKWKELIICYAVIAGMIGLAAYGLGKIYAEFAGFLTVESAVEAATTEGGSGYSGEVDRLTFISVINEHIFDAFGIGGKAFGVGMGNAEYASFGALTSSLYNKIGENIFYLHFSSATIYLEAGIVGLILYAAANAVLFCQGTWNVVKRNGDRFYESVGAGAALVSLVYIIYNNLQRTDMAILLALFIAVPVAVKFHEAKEKV